MIPWDLHQYLGFFWERSFWLGFAFGAILVLVLLTWAERVDKRNAGDLLEPSDAGASAAARKHSEPYDQEAEHARTK